MPFQKGNQVNKGRTPWMKGRKHSEKSKRKMSIVRKKSSCKFWKGKKFSKEHCKNISEAKKKEGNKSFDSYGYVHVKTHTHPFRKIKNIVFEHRLVMEKHIRRYLLPEEIVHHINGNPQDNELENLMLFPNESAHKKFHHKYTKSYKSYKYLHRNFNQK